MLKELTAVLTLLLNLPLNPSSFFTTLDMVTNFSLFLYLFFHKFFYITFKGYWPRTNKNTLKKNLACRQTLYRRQ